MQRNETTEVTAAIIVEDGCVLVARRPPGGRHPGSWEFPGGKVDPGETPEECLARELAEELGIEVLVGKRLAVVHHEYPDLAIDLLAFECAISRGRPMDLACAEHAWVKPEELSSFDLLPPDRYLVALLQLRD